MATERKNTKSPRPLLVKSTKREFDKALRKGLEREYRDEGHDKQVAEVLAEMDLKSLHTLD